RNYTSFPESNAAYLFEPWTEWRQRWRVTPKRPCRGPTPITRGSRGFDPSQPQAAVRSACTPARRPQLSLRERAMTHDNDNVLLLSDQRQSRRESPGRAPNTQKDGVPIAEDRGAGA